MDTRHKIIKDDFFKSCKKQNMIEVKSAPLLTDDKTVYFASATITPLKEILVTGQIPKNNLYLHQQCFRLQTLENPFYNGAEMQYPGYFNMLGTLVHPKNIISFQETIAQIVDGQGISQDKVKVAASSKDKVLVEGLSQYYEVEYDTRDEKSYNWVYGMGDNITGRGLTLLLRKDDGCYKRIGQYIAIKDKEKLIGCEYGVGIEVLLARKYSYKNEYDAFSISPILIKNELDANFTNAHIFSSVASAYSTGITLSNYPRNGHKKLLNKMLNNLALLKIRDGLSEERIQSILNEFLIVEFGNDTVFPHLITDFKTKEYELEKQINQAEDFTRNQKRLGKSYDFIKQRILELYPLYMIYVKMFNKSL